VQPSDFVYEHNLLMRLHLQSVVPQDTLPLRKNVERRRNRQLYHCNCYQNEMYVNW
jgi:hypothetical protein